jgi:hypothetical protein
MDQSAQRALDLMTLTEQFPGSPELIEESLAQLYTIFERDLVAIEVVVDWLVSYVFIMSGVLSLPSLQWNLQSRRSDHRIVQRVATLRFWIENDQIGAWKSWTSGCRYWQ